MIPTCHSTRNRIAHPAGPQYPAQTAGGVHFGIGTAEELIRIRAAQMLINEKYKKGEFKIPIHLALGHEAIAVAVSSVMHEDDQLSLPHRNIHYNLARCASFKAVVDEFLLREEGLGKARLGAMNLANEQKGIAYTSSILGNNLSVAAGLALAKKVNGSDGIIIVVTGDGAMEEGAFYESLLFMKSHYLRVIIIVENNGWSLATQIHERRCKVHLNRFADAFEVKFLKLSGNDVFQYIHNLTRFRNLTIETNTPTVVEVELETLGDWRLKTEAYPHGKYINYHAGSAPTVEFKNWPLIQKNISDPLFVLSGYFDTEKLKAIAIKSIDALSREIR